MMNLPEEYLGYYENKTAQVVKLSYKNTSLSAVIILPKWKFVRSFVNAFDPSLMERLESRLVILSLPRFKIDSDMSLVPVLEKLGVDQVFKHMDCMDTLGDVMKIEQVKQKACISIDENGTEAVAVTKVKMKGLGACPFELEPEKPVCMVCDHPFWFLIVDNDYRPVFVASYV